MKIKKDFRKSLGWVKFLNMRKFFINDFRVKLLPETPVIIRGFISVYIDIRVDTIKKKL